MARQNSETWDLVVHLREGAVNLHIFVRAYRGNYK